MTCFSVGKILDLMDAANNEEELTEEMDRKLVKELREKFPETRMSLRFIRYE